MGNHYLPGWYQWRFHLILGGDFNREIIRQIQKWLTGDFKTESLVYRGDIHGESLLTRVVSMVVSFDSRRGFQSRNHLPESKMVRWRFQNRIISVSGGYSREIITYRALDSWRGFQSRNHLLESKMVGWRFQNRIISVLGGYPQGIITYHGGINCGFI